MGKRIKPRLTFTLTRKQIKILETYGGKNKSSWIGERIEEWYILNRDNYERLTNKIKWTQLKKIELEDQLWMLYQMRKKLDKFNSNDPKNEKI